MDTSPNFAFLANEFPQVAESASYAELHRNGDPRAAMSHARHVLGRLIKRIYKLDKTLQLDVIIHQQSVSPAGLNYVGNCQ